MPWCGFWGATGAFWWVLPLIALVVMGVMFFVCFRRFGCFGRMGGCRCRPEHGPSESLARSGRAT